MTTQFDKIYHGINKEVGSTSHVASSPFHDVQINLTEFRVAASGMAWKAIDAEPVVAMGSKEIKWAQWLRVARGYQLRVGLINHRKETFDGFQREVLNVPVYSYAGTHRRAGPRKSHQATATALQYHVGIQGNISQRVQLGDDGLSRCVYNHRVFPSRLSEERHRPRIGVHRSG